MEHEHSSYQERRKFDHELHEKLTKLSTQIVEIQGELKLIHQQINSASHKDDDHKAEVNELRKAVSALEKVSVDVQKDTITHEKQLTILTTELSEVKKEVKSISSSVSKAGYMITGGITLAGFLMSGALQHFLKLGAN